MEEDVRVLDVADANRLADRVHRPAGDAEVDGAQPVRVEMIGPMVLPHGQSFFTMNSCTLMPASRASSRTTKPLSPSVA